MSESKSNRIAENGSFGCKQTLWAAFDFPQHPLDRHSDARIQGAFYQPPDEMLVAHHAHELQGVIDNAHQAACHGAWVLGGLRYEAASALDPHLQTHPSHAALAEFFIWHSKPQPWPTWDEETQPMISEWVDLGEANQQIQSIQRVREWIRAGDCYQVNLTTRLSAHRLEHFDLGAYFFSLYRAQPRGFALFIRDHQHTGGVASVSPELFFDWRPSNTRHLEWQITTQPMKGTAPRSTIPSADAEIAKQLSNSEKERAENLMIVDLLRNDLSRVAVLGTVKTPQLFELHELPTVWQMTSTITAQSQPNTRLSDIFKALFPCGSVTGAPKVRAMQIIQALEAHSPRGWYCGALGIMQPGGASTFNVPIRTIETTATNALRCGIGSGITFDSEPQAELAEWRTKRRFLKRAAAPISALETLRLEHGSYPRMALHIARMARCAAHFHLQWCQACVEAYLAKLAKTHPSGVWRVRLTMNHKGKLTSQVQALEPVITPQPVRLALARKPIPPLAEIAEFIHHKTTRREVYDAFQAEKPSGLFDWILWNEYDEITEGTFGNIALKIQGQWLTPTLNSGLLPGIMREELLQSGKITEARLTKEDLKQATQVAFFNSLRGWLKAVVVGAE